MKFLDELLHSIDHTPIVTESVNDDHEISLTADKLMELAVAYAIEELTQKYGENYQDYQSSNNAVADEAMKIIRYYTNFADVVEHQDRVLNQTR